MCVCLSLSHSFSLPLYLFVCLSLSLSPPPPPHPPRLSTFILFFSFNSFVMIDFFFTYLQSSSVLTGLIEQSPVINQIEVKRIDKLKTVRVHQSEVSINTRCGKVTKNQVHNKTILHQIDRARHLSRNKG